MGELGFLDGFNGGTPASLVARGGAARSHRSSGAVGGLRARDRGGGAHTGRAQEKQRWPEAASMPS